MTIKKSGLRLRRPLLVFLIILQFRSRSRRRLRRRDVMVRREEAQAEFGAGGGVGRVGGGQFQVGGVLDGQNVFVGFGGVGGFHAGRLFGVALAGLLDGGAGGKGGAHGGEGLRLGIRPAFEFQRGQICGGLHGGQNDVGAAQHGTQFVRFVDADLKFLTQLHRLAGKRQLRRLARLAHAMQQQGEVGLLGKGEVAGFALGQFLAGGIGGQFAEGGGGFGEIVCWQARGDLGIFQRGGDDEVAIVADDGDRAVRFMIHNLIRFECLILSCQFANGKWAAKSRQSRQSRKWEKAGCFALFATFCWKRG